MQTIYLDISNKGVIPCIQAKQSEVGRKFLAIITDNGVPYEIPDNSLLSVWYEGDTDAGNYSSINNVSAFDIDGNKVTVELVAQMLFKPGNGELCLSITHGNGGETNTWNIPYCVEYKPGAGSSVPTEYYTALTEAGVIATQAANEAKKAAEEAKNAVVVLPLIMPVGYVFHWCPVDNNSIDLSTAENVHNYFGFGTWEQIEDRFLLSAGDNHPAGEVGGSEYHTITNDEMPPHSHELEYKSGEDEGWMKAEIGRDGATTGSGYLGTSNSVELFKNYTVRIKEEGGGNSMHILPPYLAVYTWKRIA